MQGDHVCHILLGQEKMAWQIGKLAGLPNGNKQNIASNSHGNPADIVDQLQLGRLLAKFHLSLVRGTKFLPD